MKTKYATILKLAMVACVASALPMQAATITFDTGGTQTNPNTFGNIRTFTSGGITLTVTAWGVTGGTGPNVNTLFQTANSGQYANLGLGICNKSEGLGCDDPSHQIDNSGPFDFMLIQFSSPVNLTSALIHPYCGSDCPNAGWDRDVTYFAGTNIPANLDLTGTGIGSLPSGFGAAQTINNSPGGSLAITLSGTGVNALLIGTADPNPDTLIDRFKLESVSFTVTPTVTSTPEPATFGLVGASLALLGLVRRAKRQRA